MLSSVPPLRLMEEEILFLERIVLGMLIGYIIYDKFIRKRRVNLPADISAYLATINKIKAYVGDKNVLSWNDVQVAPVASMKVDGLPEGQAESFKDGRGAIYKFKLIDGVYVNMYFTKAGYRRSGDLHDCTQYDVVLRGRTRLRMLDPHTGKEIVREYGANDFIVIPARTPHMFEFLEDNCLLEWWENDFKAWYYNPYRTIINQNLPLSATEQADFSMDPKRQLLKDKTL